MSRVYAVMLLLLTSSAWGAEAATGELFRQCMDSPRRSAELDAMEDQGLQGARAVAVPAEYTAILARLHEQARLPTGAVPSIVAVSGGGTASALGSGVILLSDGWWRDGLIVRSEEVAALLAHELAHLELQDAKREVCDRVALLGPLSEEAALDDVLRAAAHTIAAGDSRLALELAQRRHRRQLQADSRAAELLEAIGISRVALGRLLLRISAVDAAGYAGLPPVETRLENLGLDPASLAPGSAR